MTTNNIKYVNFEYDIFIKQTKQSIQKFIYVLVGKNRKSRTPHIIQITRGPDVIFELGQFMPYQMYHLIKYSNFGQWTLTDSYIEKINEYYDEAFKKVCCH
jgi:hypothetical protein